MKPNKKETDLLNDLKSGEKFCVEKYARAAKAANDKQLKDMFENIGKEEEVHLNSIETLLSGKVPDMSGGNGENAADKAKTVKAHYSREDNSEKKMSDAYLCSDALGTEKHISAEYNTDIFEFVSPQVREMLNHIQKEEQQHGEMIYDYMSTNGMY